MKKKLTKVQKLLLGVMTAILLAGIAGVYFLMINPLYDRQDQVENSLRTEQQLLTAVKKQLKEIQSEDRSEEELSLQTRVPLHPFIEQLFYEMNEAQANSDSVIVSYNISDRQTATVPLEGEASQGLMEVNFDLEVQSPSYEQLTSFIDNLEKSERIISIDSVAFSEPQDANADIVYQLSLSAFFKEGLDGITNHPSIDIPDPANKENPLRR
jgi:type IV pilus assembly protein PilO